MLNAKPTDINEAYGSKTMTGFFNQRRDSNSSAKSMKQIRFDPIKTVPYNIQNFDS